MTADFESEASVRRSIRWVIAFSVGLMLLGILTILLPVIASAFFTALIGWIILASGIVMILESFYAKPVRGFWLNLVVGICYGVTGIYILFNLQAALLVLVLAFGVLFLVEGVFTIVMAFVNRAGNRMFWLVAFNGIVTLILGVMILNRWPASAIWLIGLYVGISLLMSGISLLSAALFARRVIT